MACRCISFLLLSFCCFFSVPAGAQHSKVNEDFDYLLLAQFWPATSAVYFENEHQPWYIPADVRGWTVHGLWPSIPGTEKPDYCNKSMKFDFNQIKVLYKTLNENWPYYGKSKPETELWDHEWTKHGTCAFSMPELQGEVRYFSKTLNLHAKLNTIKALAASNIIPSETQQYSPEDIFDAIKKGYGTSPGITCIYDQKNKIHHLEQVWLCYSKSFELMDCPDINSTRGGSSTLYFQNLKEKGPASSINSHFEGCPLKGTVYYKPIPRQ